MGSARLQGFVSYPGGSAVWPQCWLCAVCALGHVGCCVGGGYPMGVSISSSRVCFYSDRTGSACSRWWRLCGVGWGGGVGSLGQLDVAAYCTLGKGVVDCEIPRKENSPIF